MFYNCRYFHEEGPSGFCSEVQNICFIARHIYANLQLFSLSELVAENENLTI